MPIRLAIKGAKKAKNTVARDEEEKKMHAPQLLARRMGSFFSKNKGGQDTNAANTANAAQGARK